MKTQEPIDATCSLHAGDGTYTLPGVCTNCDLRAPLLLTRGHAFPGGWAGGPPCPNCGCRNWCKEATADA